MSTKIYPNLQDICRLCLKENAGTVFIFPEEKSSSDKFSALSIPMRIMTCASLEVKYSDDFPKKICIDCRLQLEKSYYFRKMSQASDTKLKKHMRLVSMGKISKVFEKKLEDDDDIDENEHEFKISVEFIEEHESRKKQEENEKFEQNINEIRLQHEKELETAKETIKAMYQNELLPLMREDIKKDLRVEIQNELEVGLRQAIMDQCLIEAKELVRNELREECRQSEIKSLLDDLQTYLTYKKQTLEESSFKDSDVKEMQTNKNQTEAIETQSRMEYVEMELQSQPELKVSGSNETVVVEEHNINDEECDSEEHFLNYDTDEGFEVQRKESENIEEHQANTDAKDMNYEDEEMENSTSYTKINTTEIIDNNEESHGTTITSYRIDNESGEIQFLKKSENLNELEEDNLDQTSYDNIMIIKIPDSDGDCLEELEEANCSKPVKQLSSKYGKSPEKNTKSIISTSVARTKTTVEATVLTKTYVNPMQRSTDTPKIFRCNACPIVFSKKTSLDRHLRTHEKVEKNGITYQCSECRIVVSSSSALRRHMYTHYEEKPFKCNLCNKSFVQREILKRHIQSHTGVKPHKCPHCERAFAQRINLNQHINRHHLEEPRVQQHSCHFCPKRFNHASGLSRHLATHNGVAFQCSECDRTFGDRSSIKRHIANMHLSAKASKNQNK